MIGSVHDVVVDGFTHGGEGVARVGGKAVFVAGTIPGERVRIRVTDDRRRWARAELVEVLDAHPGRVEPPCRFVPECGGCDLQHVAPETQLDLKRRVVIEQLERLGGITDPPVAECRPTGPPLGYRNHVQLHAAPDGRLGFRRARSHDVVAIDVCAVASDEVNRLRHDVGDTTQAAGAVLRAHPATDTSAVVLHPGEEGLHVPDGAFDVLLAQPDGSAIALRGTGELRETIGAYTYRFDATSFFQVSSHGAAELVVHVLEALGDPQGLLVWDLYAGVGLFSLPLAGNGAEVVAVESDAQAAARAIQNAQENATTVAIVQERVDDFVFGFDARTDDPPDVVVLDPPRSGAGPKVTGRIAEIAPGSVVYVACDVAALARDARTLSEHGYRLAHAVPLDMFPMTHHVEVVARFES